jgi:prepilin-type N-terminal cleavage/methylation domain-containing protein
MRATWATGSARAQGLSVRWEGGFTLMELLVVIVILVLLSSALPLALDRTLPSRRVLATTRQLIAAIRNAQSLSAACGRPVQLQLSGAELAGEGIFARFPVTTHVTLQGADGVSLNALSVYPEGTSTEARIVVSERAHQRTLYLSSLTGRITLEVAARER